jgi:capsid protein
MASLFNRLGSAWRELTGPTNSAPQTPFGTGGNGITSNVTFSPRQLHQMKPYERNEAMKTSRWLDNNLGIIGALNDNSVSYAIGSGINRYSATGDPDFDASADRFLNALFESTAFDIAEEQTMYEMQCVAARGMIVDGDCGAAKILQRDARGNIASGPQVQMFTSDQIGSTAIFGTLSSQASGWQEGILRNAVGKAITYRVLKGDSRFLTTPTSASNYWDYQARDFLLLLDRKRIQLSRGIPWCHRAQRSAQSMLTLGALTEAREHINALFAAIITTPTGETPEALENFIMDSYGSATNEKADGTIEQKAVLHRYVEMMGGAKVPVFPEGTKLDAYTSNSNSAIYAGAMDYLVTQIALSYGIPPAFVWAAIGAGKGPDIRNTLAQASWYFNRILLITVRRFVKPLSDWALQYGILTGQVNGGRVPRNGADYRLATFHGPRDITIDERYYHKTWLDRLADGKGTEEEYFSLQGLNAETQALKRIKEIAQRKQWCLEAGIEYHGDYIRSAPGTNIGAQAVDPALADQQQALLDAAA